MVLKDAILVTGKEDADARERQAEGRIKRNEKWGTKDMEHQDLLCNIIDHHIKFHLSDDFSDISDTTHPNLAIHSLWLTQPWGSIPLRIESSHWIKSAFHLYPIFPMMSHCVLFYYSDLSSDLLCCSKMELSSDSLMSNCLQISEMLLSHPWFPPVYKEALLPQRKKNQVLGFILSSALLSKI